MDRPSPVTGVPRSPSAVPSSLLDLIPLSDLQHLQDAIAALGSVASVVTDPDGIALTLPSHPFSICRMICQAPAGNALCLQSDQSLLRRVRLTLHTAAQPCGPFGFPNAVIPVMVEGLHLANWWVKQPCFQIAALEKAAVVAGQTGVSRERLLAELNALPECRPERFEQLLGWIDTLIREVTELGFQGYTLSRKLSRLHRVENELQKYRSHLEILVQERTAELSRANQRLQLEVMERNLVEEQIERKSRLLDAINQILQQTLTDRSDHVLAATFLKAARQLTGSAWGFIVAYQENGWNLIAAELPGTRQEFTPGDENAQFEVIGIWREVIESSRTIVAVEPAEQPGRGLPPFFPGIKNLLVVPLRENNDVCGFIALANTPDSYARVDQQDSEALGRVYTEAVLRKRSERARATSEKRLHLALDSANEGLWDYFPLQGQIYYSPNWFVMLGYPANEFPNTLETWSTLTHPDDLPILEDALQHAARGGAPGFDIEIRMLSENSQWRWIQARGRSVETGADGRVIRIVGTLSDISKYKQVELALQKANEELQRLAALDGLTQIANRMRFEDRLTQEWRRARREEKSLALIICDIDYFKNYNDTYGHLKGDEALYTVAQTISSALKRPMDLVARYGGEEFGMILPNTDVTGALRVAREVKAAVDGLRIEHKASRIGRSLSLSFGVAATVPAAGASLRDLMESADQALYKAKAMGRDRIVADAAEVPEPEMPEAGGSPFVEQSGALPMPIGNLPPLPVRPEE